MGRLRRILSLTVRRLWVRTSLFGVAAILAALIAIPLPQFMPKWMVDRASDAPVAEILTILASSMLAVATFSLGAMVTAFGSATSNATPRAARVLIDDPISQNALATFIGAFVFAIVGLIAHSVGVYGDDGRAVLLGAVIAVITFVIVTLFGWVDYLANLARLGAVVDKLEDIARARLKERAVAPYLGAAPAVEASGWAGAILSDETGYVAHIDLAGLQAEAKEQGGVLQIEAVPGAFVGPDATLARASWPADDEGRARIADCFVIESERSFDQDPRYAMIVLSEVASRALSPGVNDPGTAIGLIGRLQRLVTFWVTTPAEAGPPEHPDLRIPPLRPADLLDDAFGPLARDGAGMVEVGLRLQKTLAALARLGDAELARAAIDQSARALAQAEHALVLDSDRDRLAAVAPPEALARAGGRKRRGEG